MSRLTESEAKGLMDAYNAVYASQEEVVEEVEKLNEAQKDKGVSANVGGVRVGVTDPETDIGARASRAISSTMSRFGSALGRFGSSAERVIQRAGGYNVPSTQVVKTKPEKPKAERQGPPVPERLQKPAAPAPAPTSTSTATTKITSVKPESAPKPSGTPMQQWAAKFPKLAAKVTTSGERAGTQMGTGQSTMSKQAAELRAMRERISSKPIMAQKEYDAYDLVLEYLLDTKQVSTVDEAHYVMLEMNSEMIQAIVKEMI